MANDKFDTSKNPNNSPVPDELTADHIDGKEPDPIPEQHIPEELIDNEQLPVVSEDKPAIINTREGATTLADHVGAPTPHT